MAFSPTFQPVDVFFNGEYQGLYLKSIQVSAVTPIVENLATSRSDPSRTEFLIEQCYRIANNPAMREGVDFLRINDIVYEIQFPTGDRLTPAHIQYVRDFIQRIDDMIIAGDPAVLNYIDVPSFIDFYLVQELFKNLDAGHTSLFFQIRGEGEDRRLVYGPVWDFDLAAGNAYYQDMGGRRGGYGPTGIWVGDVNRWLRHLKDIPEYR